jgi:hypothetical protein
VPVAPRVMSPFHWYSDTVPTRIEILLALMVVVREHTPPLKGPYTTVAVVADWSVAKLMATWRSTRSVR